LQYTAFNWSRFGIPIMLLVMLWMLRVHHVHILVMFHDAQAQTGRKLRHRARGFFQLKVMQLLCALAHVVVLNVPLETVSWIPATVLRARFIPNGSNIPFDESIAREYQRAQNTIVVFGITGGKATTREVDDIAYVAQYVSHHVQPLRLIVVGRGSSQAEPTLRTVLQGVNVELIGKGVLPPEEVARVLADADAFLFVRGGISTQRGSALAGVAAGLPIVAYAGQHTGYPLTEAGLVAVPYGDCAALAQEMTRVLTDDRLWQELCQRSFQAQQTYFSWDVIARCYLEEIGCV
jgi:glycosyltransferase involved in cell wall biosynthesis